MAQPFNFDSLLSNPSFMFGASILGNSWQPGVVGNSFGNVARMQELSSQRQLQAAQIANYKATQEHQAAQDKIAQQQFERLDQSTQMDLLTKRRQFEMQQNYIRAHPDLFGADLGAPQGGPGQPTGAQGNSLEFNMPPNGMPAGAQQPGQIQPVAPYNPDDPSDPAGPFSGGARDGTFGTPQPGSVRPPLKTSGPITPQLLNGLERTESGGNPNAIGPPIPGKPYRAQGAFQFIPPTVDMLAKQGIKFDPFNRGQSRQAAGAYLGNLTQQHGGSIDRAIAAYKGFSDVNSPAAQAAVRKVYTAAGMQPAGQQDQQGQGDAPGGPVNIDGGMPDPGLKTMRDAAAMGFLGFPGAQQLSEYGKALSPQNVPAGSYSRDPRTGRLQYNQDPMATARLGQEAQRIGMEGQRVGMESQRLGMEKQKQQYEMGNGSGALPQKAMDAINTNRFDTANAEINKSLDLHKELPNQLQAIKRAQSDVDKLLDPKTRNAMTPVGFAANVKLTVLKTFKNTFGYDAPKDVANAEDFNSAMSQLWMKAVKQVDQNPTANQQKSIMASFGTLQNDPAALKRILAETQTSFERQMQRHNKAVAQYQTKVGADPFDRFLDSGSTTPAGTRVGQEENGYIYIGGNPADQSSWTK